MVELYNHLMGDLKRKDETLDARILQRKDWQLQVMNNLLMTNFMNAQINFMSLSNNYEHELGKIIFELITYKRTHLMYTCWHLFNNLECTVWK